MYNSSIYGNVELQDVPVKIKDYFERMKGFGSDFKITVGSDSQSFDTLKLVNVIAVTCQGHGGIFFYEVTRLPRTNNVREKLITETNESLKVMTKLLEVLEDPVYAVMKNHFSVAIHIDAGYNPNGKTRELIPELVGWIKGCALACDVEVKPDAFVASTIADKISK